MKRCSRRFILNAVILLIAGATLNVAVAWGLASPQSAGEFEGPVDYVQTTHEDGTQLDGMVLRKMGTSYIAVSYLQHQPPRENREDVAAFIHRQPLFARHQILRWFGKIDAPTPRSKYIAVIARGWPLLALFSIEEIGFNQQSGTRIGITNDGAIVVPMKSRPNTGHAPFYAIALPCLPVWPGFAVNTLLYAGVLWMLFCGPFALRRMIRRRRGQCPQCAYPVGTSEVCTECGAVHRDRAD